MNEYQIVLTARCQELSQVAWDDMCGAKRPFSKIKWLQLLEETVAHYDPQYAQIWQGDKLVAGLICHPQRHFHLSAHMDSQLMAWGATQLLNFVTPLSCLLPLYAAPGLVVADNTAVADIQPTLATALKQLQRQQRSQLLSINPLSTETDTEWLNWQGFAPTTIVDDAVLDITWDSYHDYQMWLPGKKRAEIRRVRNRAADAGVHVELCTLAQTDGARIEELMKMVMEHHGSSYMFKPDVVQKTAVLLNPNDYCHMVAIHQGDIIGTLTLFCSEGVVLVRWAGLDYERTRDTYAYHLLMSETVRLAIEMGAKQLKLGGTVFTLKKQLGARLEPRRALLKMRNPLLNKAMGTALNWRSAKNLKR